MLTKKIEFLERECRSKDIYIEELEEVVKINKQTLRELTEAPIIKAYLDLNNYLLAKIKQYSTQIRQINAQLLMESQMRQENKGFEKEKLRDL